MRDEASGTADDPQRARLDLDAYVQADGVGYDDAALAEETARIAAKQLAAEQARFEGGSSTSLPVLEAEDTLRSAQLRVARARADVLTTNLAIQHLTGRLLDDYAKLLGRAAPRTGARRGRSTALAPRVGAF